MKTSPSLRSLITISVKKIYESNEALSHVVEVRHVGVEHLAEVRSDGACGCDLALHVLDVVMAVAEIVSDCTHLLHFLSENAVKSCPGLKQTDIGIL